MKEQATLTTRFFAPDLLKNRAALHVVDGIVRVLDAQMATSGQMHRLVLVAGDWVFELQQEVRRLTGQAIDDEAEGMLLADLMSTPNVRTDVINLYEQLTVQVFGELQLTERQLQMLSDNLAHVNQLAAQFTERTLATPTPTVVAPDVAACVRDDKPLADPYDQTKKLMDLFSGLRDRRIDTHLNESLTFVRTLHQRRLPDGATGWLAVIRWEMIAKTYASALEQMSKALRIQRGFDNLLWSMDCLERVKPRDEARHMFEEAVAGQTGAIVYIPAQMSGRVSNTNAVRLWKQLPSKEFPLDTFTVGCLAMTHGYRFCGAIDTPEIVCAGDTVRLNDRSSEDEIPRFHCPELQIMLDCTPKDSSSVSRSLFPTGIVT